MDPADVNPETLTTNYFTTTDTPDVLSWFEYLRDHLPDAEIESLLEDDNNCLELYRTGYQRSARMKGSDSLTNKADTTATVKNGPMGIIDAENDGKFDKSRFRKREMDNKKKFWLKFGRSVEDVMFSECIKFKYEHTMHSFLYNADNVTTTKLFNRDKNIEIQSTNMKSNPNTKLEDLKKSLFNTSHPELFQTTNEEYWMCQTFHSFLYDIWMNASKNDTCFLLDQSESWILANPLHFVQILFHDHKDIFVIGGEKGGFTSQGDGYVRILGSDSRDVAAIEAGPKWEGPGATKALVETLKVMHDRLDNSVEALAKLAVPGLAIYRDRYKQLKLDHVQGYVTHVVSTPWMSLSMSGCVKDNMALFIQIFIFQAWVLPNKALARSESGTGEEEAIMQLLHNRLVKDDVAET
ncbi:hypothetical protein HDU81_009682 [Chytriomyces hyalinus]|nr:hypothetical protein HDU81_009682 [Chytriomyces hyalinus]